MKRIGDLLEKHRNAFLITLLAATFIVSSQANKGRTHQERTVDIPVMAVETASVSAVTAFLRQRNADTLTDMAALEALIGQAEVDENTRQAAAIQLADLVAARQAQAAIEGALATSSLYPCAAVISGGTVTLVTEKSSLDERDSARVMELAALHAGIEAANVRIITAD